jgi:hypothetical protein
MDIDEIKLQLKHANGERGGNGDADGGDDGDAVGWRGSGRNGGGVDRSGPLRTFDEDEDEESEESGAAGRTESIWQDKLNDAHK